MDETVEQPADLEEELRRRARLFRRLRIAVLALVVGYFFLPYDIRTWIPVWLPFLAALGLEIDFFVGGWLKARSGEAEPSPLGKHGPQPRDLADFGGPSWQEAFTVEHDGEQILVPAIGATAEDDEGLADEDEPSPAAAAERRSLWKRHPWAAHAIEAGAAVAIVAGILVYASRPHGWSAVSPANQARAEALFSREAAKIAGHPATVTCDRSGRFVGFTQDADGLAFVGGRRAYLVPGLCDRLYQLAFKHRVQSFPETGRAIAVLAHESWHLRGVANEGLANCYAFQSGVRVGVDLGLSEGTARAMMREQLATNASDAGGNVAYVVPPGCHDGGAQDLHPGSNAFP